LLNNAQTTYLDLVHETLGCAFHPRGLFRLRELLVSNKVVLALAPHIDVLAAVTGTTLDLFYVVVRGHLGLLMCRITSGRGYGHHRPLVQARGAHGR